MRKNFLFVSFLLLIVNTIIIISCKKENNKPTDSVKKEIPDTIVHPKPVTIGYSKGAFIVCEGGFGKNNGTILLFKPDSSKMISSIFENANKGIPAGDVVQSFSVNDTFGIIAANNSGLLRIVNAITFKLLAEVPVYYPRFSITVNTNKSFISCGNLKGKVYVMNVSTQKLTDSINVGIGPEHMLNIGNEVYVCNNGGFNPDYSSVPDSTVDVIDISKNKVIKSIYVQAINPTDLVIDANNDIWVLCKGSMNYTTMVELKSKLVKVSSTTKEVVKTIEIGASGASHIAVSPDRKTIYYLENDGVYSLDVSTATISTKPIITGSFYGMNVNPKDGNIYCLDAGDFSSAGLLKIYGTDGTKKAEYATGIGPNGVVFNL
jgi:hypothetical protein